jgi:hypothetical protein
LIVIALSALLLVNYVQWVRLEQQRALAEAHAAEAMRARQAAEAALVRAQAATAQYSAQAAQQAAKPEAVPKKTYPGEEKP